MKPLNSSTLTGSKMFSSALPAISFDKIACAPISCKAARMAARSSATGPRGS